MDLREKSGRQEYGEEAMRLNEIILENKMWIGAREGFGNSPDSPHQFVGQTEGGTSQRDRIWPEGSERVWDPGNQRKCLRGRTALMLLMDHRRESLRISH